MIPKLYVAVNNNIAALKCIGLINRSSECLCKRTINSEYTLELTTDIDDYTAPNLTTLKFIGAKPSPSEDEQYFIINKTERTIDGRIKVYAEHIHSLCNHIMTDNQNCYEDEKENQIENATAQEAWNELISGCLPNGFIMPFAFTSSISTRANFWLGTAKSETFGNILSDNDGGFLNLYGGEYDFDNLRIIHKPRLGSIKKYTLRYGANVSDATQTEDCTNMYSHVLAYAVVKDGAHSDKTINLSSNPVEIIGTMCPINRTYTLDCTEEMKDFVVYSTATYNGSLMTHYPGQNYTEARNKLAEIAQKYAKRNNLGIPNISISVTHRSELINMKEISIGDTVNVVLDNMGTIATARITATEYDVLNEWWSNLQIGESKVTLATILLNPKKYINGTFK